MPRYFQRSFAGGLLSPELHARSDLAKYDSGLAQAKNVIVLAHGSVANRAGTEFVAETKDSTKASILIPFKFGTVQNYILEVGDQYIRFISNGGRVVVSSATAWLTATDYVPGQQVTDAGVNYICLADHVSAGAPPTAEWYAQTGIIVEIPTPYLEAELARLKFTQSADILTLTHPAHPPRELRRTGNDMWELRTPTFRPSILPPTNLVAVITTGLTNTVEYVVTSIHKDSYEESLSSEILTIVNVDVKKQVKITWDPADNAGKYNVYRRVDYDTGGSASRRKEQIFSFVGTSDRDRQEWDEEPATTSSAPGDNPPTLRLPFREPDWETLEVYFVGDRVTESGLIYECIVGHTAGVFATDLAALRWAQDLAALSKHPSTVTYHQQRIVYGASNEQPQTLWFSQTGSFQNFNTSTPILADDAVTFAIASREVHEIRHIVALSGLLILTSGGEWLAKGGDGGAISPNSISITAQSYRGTSHVRPLVLGSTLLYIQERGSIVRDLAYTLESDNYTGNDLSILAQHLFKLHTVVSWDYAQVPDSVIWAARDDGALLSLTYLREHQVWGWCEHETQGRFEWVAVIPEDLEDATYFTVRRRVVGVWKRFIERMHSRVVEDSSDAFFVDSGLTIDIPLVIEAVTSTDPGVFTVTTHGFLDGDPIDLNDLAGPAELGGLTDIALLEGRYIVANKTPNTFELVGEYSGLPLDTSIYTAHEPNTGEVRKAFTTFAGLGHLEGMTIGGVANGDVFPPTVVTGGAISLPKAASIVHAGLLYESVLQTLRIDLDKFLRSPTRTRRIVKAYLHFVESRGAFVASSPDDYVEIKWRSTEGWNESIDLFTGVHEIAISGRWDQFGYVYVRQIDPLPFTLRGIEFEVQVGQ